MANINSEAVKNGVSGERPWISGIISSTRLSSKAPSLLKV